jgi:TP901 family phage tail tape measure protein
MANSMTNATINVSANTRQMEKDILKSLRSIEMSEIGTKKSSQALGRITGQVSEFNKSLEASNARVIAFGASAGVIYGVEKALTSLISSTIEVEKKLADINVLLNLSGSSLEKFGSSLFDVARNTAQSFSTVADAATELSRQGLGVEETLKRTNAALVLTRLSGLDAKSSVEALTATLNSFSGSVLDATGVVNKLANVDAAFAISSADLANAISRVGSTAQDAGVSLDELISIVTAAQQTTARGGAVIGNSLKTIFTRLQRGKVQDLLGSLGVDTSEGQSAISLLQQLASTYDKLGASQKSYVAEQVGGVFQINILKAALGDLGKEYSIYDRALSTSLSSTDQAIRRNAELNKTVSALSSQAVANLEQAASKIGSIVFEPNAKGFLGEFNKILESFNNIDTESAGGKFISGFFKGIGNFIAGPGAVLATAVLVKLLGKFGQYAAGSVTELLGRNEATKQQAALEQSVLSILQKSSVFTEKILNGKMTTVQAEKQLLDYLTAQSNVMRDQERISKVIAANLGRAGVSIGASGVPLTKPTGKKTFSSGFVPNFASEMAVGQAMENAGAKEHGYKAGSARKTRIHDGNGKSFSSFVNSKEDVKTFTNAAGKKATVVRPPNGFGENTQYAAGGFVPNFKQIPSAFRRGNDFEKDLYQATSIQKPDKKSETLDFPRGKISGVPRNILAKAGVNKRTIYGDAKFGLNTENITSMISKYLRSEKQNTIISENLAFSDPNYSIMYYDGAEDHDLLDQKRKLSSLVKKNPSLIKQVDKSLIDQRSGKKLNTKGKNTEISLSFLADRVLESGNKYSSNSSGFVPNFASRSQMIRDLIKFNLESTPDIKNKNVFGSKTTLFRGITNKTAPVFRQSRNYSTAANAIDYFRDTDINEIAKDHVEEKKLLPFLSASTDEDIAKYFARGRRGDDLLGEGRVGSKTIKNSRIFSAESINKFIKKYGQKALKELMMENSTWGSFGSGKGIAINFRSFSNKEGFEGTDFAKEVSFLSKGFVPNFASMGSKFKAMYGGGTTMRAVDKEKTAKKKNLDVKKLDLSDRYTMVHGGNQGLDSANVSLEAGNKLFDAKIATAGLDTAGTNLQKYGIKGVVGDALVGATNNIIKTFGGKEQITDASSLDNAGSVGSAAGTVFETALRKAFNAPAVSQTQRIDFPAPTPELKKFFHNAPGQYEAKISRTPDNLKSTLKKWVDVNGLASSASGFVPNFAKSSGLSFSQSKDEFGFTTLNALMGGKKVGEFEWEESKKGVMDIGGINVNRSSRGMGIASSLYKEAIRRNTGAKMRGQLTPQIERLIEKLKAGQMAGAETLYPQIKRADLAKDAVFEVFGSSARGISKMNRRQFTEFINDKINKLKNNPDALRSYFDDIEAVRGNGISASLETQHASGFVPNFAYKLKKYGSSDDKVREIRDEKTRSFLNYAEGSANRGYPYLDMVGINSKQKGQGLELFNRLGKIAKRSGRKIRSSTIVPQIERLDSIDSNSTLEKVLKAAFPQLLYRERSNVKNSELDFQYSPYSGKSIDKTISGRGAFSLVLNELKAIGVNGKSLKENILSRRVSVSNVEDSFASGFVPNFADQVRKNMYDWDGTIIPTIRGGADEYIRQLGSLKEKDLLPIGKKLKAGKKKFDILTSRPSLFESAIRETSSRLGLPVNKINFGVKPKDKLVEAQKRGSKIVDDNLDLIGKPGFLNARVVNERLSSGFVPNFSSALNDAIAREQSSGLSKSQIYVDSHSSLKNKNNPMGLMVANTRDEPNGGIQGIKRARSEGLNPNTYGASSGFIPNFADLSSSQIGKGLKIPKAAINDLQQDLKKVKNGILDASSVFEKFEQSVKKSKGSMSNLKMVIEGAAKSSEKIKSKAAIKIKEDLVSNREERRNKKIDYLKQGGTILGGKAKSSTLGKMKGVDPIALGFGAQSVASIASQFAGSETKRGRVTGAVAEGLGDVASFASAGSIFGPWGAAIGAGVGVVTGLNKVIKATTSKMAEYEGAVAAASKEFNSINESSQAFLSASEKLGEIKSNPEASTSDLVNAQNEYIKSIAGIPEKYRSQLVAAERAGKAQEVLAQITEKVSTDLANVTLAKEIQEKAEGGKVKKEDFSSFVKASFSQTVVRDNPQTQGNEAEAFTRDFQKNIETALQQVGKSGFSEASFKPLEEAFRASGDGVDQNEQRILNSLKLAIESGGGTSYDALDILKKENANYINALEASKKAEVELQKRREQDAEKRKKEAAFQAERGARLSNIQSTIDNAFSSFSSSIDDLISSLDFVQEMSQSRLEGRKEFTEQAGAKNYSKKLGTDLTVQRILGEGVSNRLKAQQEGTSSIISTLGPLIKELQFNNIEGLTGNALSVKTGQLDKFKAESQVGIFNLIKNLGEGNFSKEASGASKEQINSLINEAVKNNIIEESAAADLKNEASRKIDEAVKAQEDANKMQARGLALAAQQLTKQDSMIKLAQAQNYGGAPVKNILGADQSEIPFGKTVAAANKLRESGYSYKNFQVSKKTGKLEGAGGNDIEGVDLKSQASQILDFYQNLSEFGGGIDLMSGDSVDFKVIQTALMKQLDEQYAKIKEASGGVIDPNVGNRIAAQKAVLGGTDTIARLRVSQAAGLATGGKEIDAVAGQYAAASFEKLPKDLKDAFNIAKSSESKVALLNVAATENQTSVLAGGLDNVVSAVTLTTSAVTAVPGIIEGTISSIPNILSASLAKSLEVNKAEEELATAKKKAEEKGVESGAIGKEVKDLRGQIEAQQTKIDKADSILKLSLKGSQNIDTSDKAVEEAKKILSGVPMRYGTVDELGAVQEPIYASEAEKQKAQETLSVRQAIDDRKAAEAEQSRLQADMTGLQRKESEVSEQKASADEAVRRATERVGVANAKPVGEFASKATKNPQLEAINQAAQAIGKISPQRQAGFDAINGVRAPQAEQQKRVLALTRGERSADQRTLKGNFIKGSTLEEDAIRFSKTMDEAFQSILEGTVTGREGGVAVPSLKKFRSQFENLSDETTAEQAYAEIFKQQTGVTVEENARQMTSKQGAAQMAIQQENQGLLQTAATTENIYSLLGQIAAVVTGGENNGAALGLTPGVGGTTQGVSINSQPPTLNIPVNLTLAGGGISEDMANQMGSLVRSELLKLKPQLEAMAKGAVGIPTPPTQYSK